MIKHVYKIVDFINTHEANIFYVKSALFSSILHLSQNEIIKLAFNNATHYEILIFI